MEKVNISFDYNPGSRSVTNIKVTDLVVNTPKIKSTNTSLQLVGGSLKLTEEALQLLNVTTGDRLCVRFNNGAILATPEALGESGGGNLVTKSCTVACKGKVGEELAKYGTTFKYELESTGYLVLTGDLQELPVEVDTEKEQEIKSVIDDSDFTSLLADGKEIDFNFEIQSK